MSDLIKLKNRHKTIKSLNSVMNAMLVVTAAKVQKAKVRFVHAVKYGATLKSIAEQICAVPESVSDENLVVAIGTNKGLCGNFNDRVINIVSSFVKGNKCVLYVMGRNLRRLKAGVEVFAEDNYVVQKYDMEKISYAARKIFRWNKSRSGSIYIAYNEYKSVLAQVPKLVKIWPFKIVESDAYVYEPSREELSDSILLQYFEAVLNRCVIESEVGELNSRMIVVKGAADSSSDMAADLMLKINKTRQSDITSELSEIVSSISALKEGEE